MLGAQLGPARGSLPVEPSLAPTCKHTLPSAAAVTGCSKVAGTGQPQDNVP
eukprot:CAMPEP_0179150430 /NCGR_PEP_ID=MMETSP0796-20121207/72957_1 /TAXON_ID=73915 /ORGANISM="Pyrodinium bahamense, Strain pbaha01" /LENGTH=50 /DNA_ID=CAMNT_0020851403 /DNA_START=64 /DNA_END=213 /DNA_ORIENTATION=+